MSRQNDRSGGATRVGPAVPAEPKPADAPAEDFDRHVFFTAKAPAPTPDGEHGLLAVECAGCHTTTRMTLLQWTKAHAPLFLWNPLMRYSRYAVCPACGERSWVRVTVSR